MKRNSKVRPLPKPLNKQGEWMGYGLLLYLAIMFLCVFVGMVYDSIRILMPYITSGSSFTMDKEIEQKLVTEVISKGTSSIVAVILGVIVLSFLFRNVQSFQDIWQKRRKMKAGNFIQILCVFMGVQLIFSFFSLLLTWGLGALGYHGMEQLEEIAQANSSTLSMFLYVGIIGPITEEIVYRGFILQGLSRFGKWFAIVVSSVLFGLMHGNLLQIPFALVVGLVLGYVAIEYSIYWSIALHMINNCIFGDVWNYLFSGGSENVQTIIAYARDGIFFVAALVILFSQRKKIMNYRAQSKGSKQMYKQFFFTSGTILFVLFCLAETVFLFVSMA